MKRLALCAWALLAAMAAVMLVTTPVGAQLNTVSVNQIVGILPAAKGGTGVGGSITGLLLGNGASATTAYGGTTCTAQFPRSLNASGEATCATVNLAAGADVTGALPIANGGTGAATQAAYTAFANWTSAAAAPSFRRVAGPLQTVIAESTNGADTNFVCVELTAIPANTLLNNGDEILVEYSFTLSAAVSSKTYQVAWGYTSCANDATGFTGGVKAVNNASVVASQTINGRASVTRISAGNQDLTSLSCFTAAGSCQGISVTGATADETAAVKIGVAIKDGTGNAAAITLQKVRVWFVPAS